MTAITGKLQGHFSSVPHSAAPSGKQGVRWCQKNGFRDRIQGAGPNRASGRQVAAFGLALVDCFC